MHGSTQGVESGLRKDCSGTGYSTAGQHTAGWSRSDSRDDSSLRHELMRRALGGKNFDASHDLNAQSQVA